MRARTPIAAALLAALAGCASCDHVPAGAVTDCNARVAAGGSATDILFVVDDSGSMTNKQQALADNLSKFIDALVASPVALDLHVAVTNTSVDDYDGRTGYGAPSNPTGLPYPGPPGVPFPDGTFVAIQQDSAGVGQFGEFLWGTAYDPAHVTSAWGGPRLLASGPDLARDFKANVHQGEWGSGKEQPLRTMRAALDAALAGTGVNFGFLRAGARLAVVILTDEDDCSESETPKHITNDVVCHGQDTPPTPLDSPYFDPLPDFASYLDTTIGSLSGEPPVVAAIAGFNATTGAATGCVGTFNSSASPRRIGALLDLLDAAHPGRTRRLSICQPFGDALLSIAQLIVPQTMPLSEAPADWRMMVVSVRRASGATVGCRLAAAGTADAATADAVFAPAPSGGQASLTFQNACRLQQGDRVELGILCAH